MIREIKRAIKEYHTIAEMKRECEKACNAFSVHTQPVYTDTSKLKDIRVLILDDDVFILIAVYLYSPIGFYGGNMALVIKSCLSDILSTTEDNIDIIFSNAYVKFLMDDEWQKKIERVFKSI